MPSFTMFLSRMAVGSMPSCIDCGFQGVDSLGGPVAPVGSGSLQVGVDHVVAEAEGLQVPRIEGDGFVAGKSHGGRAVLSVSAGVGKGIEIDTADTAVPVRAQADMDLHLVPGRTGDLGFLPGIDKFGGLSRLHGDKGRVDLADRRLLGSEAAADTRLFHADPAFGDAESLGKDPAAVEHDLGRGDHMQPAVAVQLRIGAEGLHHGLAEGLGVVGTIQHDLAVRKDGFHVAVRVDIAGHQVATAVASHGTGRVPVLLRVNQDGVILGRAEIQHRLQHLVGDFDELHGPQGGLFRLSRDDGHGVAHEAHMAVQDQAVIGRRLRIGLPRDGKAGLRHILPGIDSLYAWNLQGCRSLHLPYQGVGVGRAQKLDYQSRPLGDIVHIDRLSQQKLHGVLFADGFSYLPVCVMLHGCLLSPAKRLPFCCPDNGVFPAAARRSRSSGRGCLPGRRGSRHRWDPESPAAGRWYS